jgi:hypothetical protein
MKKDVIYIDIEDDITSIIEKVKSSHSKIVALVPPKRSTVLNSAVNMKLLQKTSDEAKKQLVLVTSDPTLVSLAAGLSMYATGNLHTKPSVPDVRDEPPALPDDVIDGGAIDEEAPVGELKDMDEALKQAHSGKNPADTAKSTKSKNRFVFKIPNFDTFRNRLIIIVAGLLLLGVGWWWAFFVAPKATVAIEAQTSRIAVDLPVTVSAADTDVDKAQLKRKVVTVERTSTEPFESTGTKNVGEKASGPMTAQNCDSSEGFTLDAGTIVTSPDGLKFEMLEAAAVPGGSFSGGGCTSPGEATITIRAMAAGTDYNLPEGTIYDIDGVGSLVTGYGGQLSGGTDKEIKVVAQKDVDGATSRLKAQAPADALSELKDKLTDAYLGIDETYDSQAGKITHSPQVGDEAASGNVTSTVTYTLVGVSREDLKAVIDKAVQTQIEGGSQTIYNDGLGTVRFALVSDKDNIYTLDVSTAAFVGPDIDTNALAQAVSGKRFSEIQKIVKEQPGVVNVEIDLEPFWVFNAPAADKISVSLNVIDNN